MECRRTIRADISGLGRVRDRSLHMYPEKMHNMRTDIIIDQDVMASAKSAKGARTKRKTAEGPASIGVGVSSP